MKTQAITRPFGCAFTVVAKVNPRNPISIARAAVITTPALVPAEEGICVGVGETEREKEGEGDREREREKKKEGARERERARARKIVREEQWIIETA